MAQIKFAFLRQALVLACVASASMAHAADAAPWASASASLSNVSYKLVDLAPQLGQTPWIKFGMPDGTGAGGFLPTSTSQQASSDGLSTAAWSPTGMSATAQFGAVSQLVAASDRYATVTVDTGMSSGTDAAPSGSIDYDQLTGQVTVTSTSDTVPLGSFSVYDFTLSPHTALVVQGSFNASTALHPELAPWDVIAHPVDVNGVPFVDTTGSPGLAAHASVVMSGVDPAFHLETHYDSMEAFLAADAPPFTYANDEVSVAWSGEEGAALNNAVSRPFSVTLSNAGDHEMIGGVGLKVGVFASVTLPAVPEPATVAMMGLGLLGVLGVRQRRRA